MPVPPAKMIILPGFFSCKANPDPLAELTLMGELKLEEIKSDMKYPSLYFLLAKGENGQIISSVSFPFVLFF